MAVLREPVKPEGLRITTERAGTLPKRKIGKRKKNFKIHRVVFYFVHQPPKTILAIGLLPTQSTRLLFGINCCPHSGPGVTHTAADLKATFRRSDAILKSAFLEFCYNHQCGCAPSSTGLITQGLQFIATDFTPRFKTSRFRRGFALRRTPTAVSRDISDFVIIFPAFLFPFLVQQQIIFMQPRIYFSSSKCLPTTRRLTGKGSRSRILASPLSWSAYLHGAKV